MRCGPLCKLQRCAIYRGTHSSKSLVLFFFELCVDFATGHVCCDHHVVFSFLFPSFLGNLVSFLLLICFYFWGIFIILPIWTNQSSYFLSFFFLSRTFFFLSSSSSGSTSVASVRLMGLERVVTSPSRGRCKLKTFVSGCVAEGLGFPMYLLQYNNGSRVTG